MEEELVVNISGRGFTKFRATVGVDESSLSSDIMPVVRFLVFSAQPDRWQLLRTEGPPPVPRPSPAGSAESLVRSLFQHALGRMPTEQEAKMSGSIVVGNGGKLSPAEVEDLLWILVLSPEFQFIS
jgi:hypothetical protein